MKRSILSRPLGSFDFPAILHNALVTAAYWNRRMISLVLNVLRVASFGLVLAVVMALLVAVALLRWVLWRIDQNWLDTIEHE